METKETNIYISPVVLYEHYGVVSFQIEVDLSNKQRPLQRHTWTMGDGTQDVDDWILSCSCLAEELIKKRWLKKETQETGDGNPK